MIYYHVDVSRVPILSDASLVLASFSDSLLRITFSDTLFFLRAAKRLRARERIVSGAREPLLQARPRRGLGRENQF